MQITQHSQFFFCFLQLSTLVTLLLPSVWILAQVMGAESRAHMKGRLCTTLGGLTFNTSVLVFVCPFPYIPGDSWCLLLKSDEGLSHKDLTLHILRFQPCLGAVKVCLHVSLQLLRRGLALQLCHNALKYICLEAMSQYCRDSPLSASSEIEGVGSGSVRVLCKRILVMLSQPL